MKFDQVYKALVETEDDSNFPWSANIYVRRSGLCMVRVKVHTRETARKRLGELKTEFDAKLCSQVHRTKKGFMNNINTFN